MKKTYKLEELGCANCAAKMEAAIAKIPGVREVSVHFITQKMVLDAEDDRLDEILQKAAKAIRRIEPDCRIAR